MTDTANNPSPQPIRVLIAEDHELVRYGLVMALEAKDNIHVVGEAENGQQAVELTQQHQPQVVLMDIGMPVMNGIDATAAIKQQQPNIKVVMLTSHKDEEEVFASLAGGADAYCMKDIKVDRLCQVLDMVMEGALWLDPAIAKTVKASVHGGGDEEGLTEGGHAPKTRKRYNTELTEREMEVLELIVQGMSNKQIARELSVTTHTAKAHVGNIISKLAVDDRTQAAVKAIQDGYVQSGAHGE